MTLRRRADRSLPAPAGRDCTPHRAPSRARPPHRGYRAPRRVSRERWASSSTRGCGARGRAPGVRAFDVYRLGLGSDSRTGTCCGVPLARAPRQRVLARWALTEPAVTRAPFSLSCGAWPMCRVVGSRVLNSVGGSRETPRRAGPNQIRARKRGPGSRSRPARAAARCEPRRWKGDRVAWLCGRVVARKRVPPLGLINPPRVWHRLPVTEGDGWGTVGKSGVT